MSYSFRQFWRGVWRAFLLRPPVRPTFARIFGMLAVFPFALLLGLMHGFFLLLDELLFPAYRKTEVREPLFILGPPRSGTTYLHRMLARDTSRFVCLSLGEMVFMPSLCERYIGWGIGRAIGRPVRAAVAWWERRQFGEYKHIHHVSMFEPEEDFVLLAYAWANALFIVVFPYLDLMRAQWYCDREMPSAERARILRHYRRCAQRHLYFHGGGRLLLSKNPMFTPLMEGLREEFPDARFIVNFRHPYSVVPSYLGLWRVLYHNLGNDPAHYLARDFIVEWLRDMFLYADDQARQLPEDRIATIQYDPLVRDPRGAIAAAYRRFGWTADPAFCAVLDEEQEKAQRYSSAHKYSLAEWGLSETQISEAMSEVFGRFGYAR